MDSDILLVVLISSGITLCIVVIVSAIQTWWKQLRNRAQFDKFKQVVELQTEYTPEQITMVADAARRQIRTVRIVIFFCGWLLLESIAPNIIQPVDQMVITILREILLAVRDIIDRLIGSI